MPYSRKEKIILSLLFVAGAVTSGNLLAYIIRSLSAGGFSLGRGLLFAYFLIYLILQVFFVWYLYSRFEKRPIPPAGNGMTVDVFVTAYNEPQGIVERTLRAALDIGYPHRTCLLDDSPSHAYRALADGQGADYLTRNGNRHFKAGNINAALPWTSGDLVAVFDIDHAPEPDFLDRTLGFFSDPRVGFVQVMQTFTNGDQNLVAEASAQTALEYFNITAVCKDRVGAMSLHGTNAVIRRRALESIGGYRPGLAEDLETSLALHGQGWESTYVCEPLAPGLSPASFRSFCKQQGKWSRGVFEAALGSLRDGTFFRLSGHQMMAYALRFSYYTLGVSFFMGMTLTLFYLFHPGAGAFEGFVVRLLPFLIAVSAIRWYMLRSQGTEPAARKGLHFKGASLVFATWPVYLWSLLSTIFRLPVTFVSTPKDGAGNLAFREIAPQIIMIGALLAGIAWKLGHWSQGAAPWTVFFAVLMVSQQWFIGFLFRDWVRALGRRKTEKIRGRAHSS